MLFLDGIYTQNQYGKTRFQKTIAQSQQELTALVHTISHRFAGFLERQGILKLYVSEKTYWMIKHHCVFQGYYYNHFLGGDRKSREKYRDSPYYDNCVYFCHHYDQNAFDPDYDSYPLEFFEPMLLRRVFKENPVTWSLLSAQTIHLPQIPEIRETGCLGFCSGFGAFFLC